MEIIKENGLNILIPKEDCLLKDKNEVLEEGQELYLTDKIYLASSITTIEQCEELWEEVEKI